MTSQRINNIFYPFVQASWQNSKSATKKRPFWGALWAWVKNYNRYFLTNLSVLVCPSLNSPFIIYKPAGKLAMSILTTLDPG